MKNLIVYICNRLWLIMLIYFVSIMVASYLFSVAESKSLFDSLWWACVTSLTVGYGDIFPVTTYGRIIGMVFGHFWIFAIIPTIVANVIFRLIENKDAFTDEEQKQLMVKLDNILNNLDTTK